MERQRTLLDLLRDSVRRVRRLHPFHIDDWVVLPDHMHCIWTLPPDTDDFPTRWRLIKLLFSKGLPPTERLSATRQRRTERGIWQRRYWEHTIVIERDYAQHVDYIHVSTQTCLCTTGLRLATFNFSSLCCRWRFAGQLVRRYGRFADCFGMIDSTAWWATLFCPRRTNR